MSETGEAGLIRGVEAIGQFLGIDRKQAEYWVASTDIPVFRIGRAVCARKATLVAWLERRETAQ